jgi:hypothetical protein
MAAPQSRANTCASTKPHLPRKDRYFYDETTSGLTLIFTCRIFSAMIRMIFILIINIIRTVTMDRADLAIENAALRQQLAVLKDKHPRSNLRPADRVFWAALRKTWTRWANTLVIVKPETVVRWHRMGFRLYWRWKSRSYKIGRPKVPTELRQLIRKMALDNVTYVKPSVMWSQPEFTAPSS